MPEAVVGQLTDGSLRAKLLAVYEYLVQNKDCENAGKAKELATKLIKQEFAVAFCGHFSAGKSTMINCLTGADLPSSPIPTSANLVKIKAGDEYAKVFFKTGKPRVYLAPYDYEMVKNYCKDGDQIQQIEISYSHSPLPDQTVILDTPGIDSADDAHRIATESAIHLADLVFYVMDYNHVQSELNFMFTKELVEAGKEVCLVINQVDKHCEEELPFSQFKDSVVASFAAWGVNPRDVFYTSLKNPVHPYNQFTQLQAFLDGQIKAKDALLVQSIYHSLQQIIKDHLAAVNKQTAMAVQPFQTILNELTVQEQQQLADEYNCLVQAKQALGAGSAQAERQLDGEVDKIMKNAYLMPFDTRALAEAYLASCQSGFKAGWLFVKQKTAAERARRLRLFYQAIAEKTKSQLEWHLRELLLQFLKEQRIDNQALTAKIQNFNVCFAEQLLSAAVKPGARLSGDTVLNYTAEVANEIKRIAQNEVAAVKCELLAAVQARATELQAKLEQQSERLERYLAAFEQVKQSQAAACATQAALEDVLHHAVMVEDRLGLFVLEQEEAEVVDADVSQLQQIRPAVISVSAPPVMQAVTQPSMQSSDRVMRTVKQLTQAAQLVQPLPGFVKLAVQLQQQAARLDGRQFTVALFGAFSAGKSSFANALIGERVLPVSPNPTTAAINKIKPVTAVYQHGTVVIQLKAEHTLLDDVNRALQAFDIRISCLADAIAAIAGLNKQLDRAAAATANAAFLQAFIRGYTVFQNRLGTVVQTTVDEFCEYVAVEETSCFVEWAELYYDCPLTRKGITLVDTPGADSINARHTGVAFDFIKNADAILFVTYYNHAFSRADREFLIQLGRVKDAFQLDKMFFMINAIDLANDGDEQQAVVDYVHDQLMKYGVRNPHLYALSSLQALQEKQVGAPANASGMSAFETDFYHFIEHDLTSLALEAADDELCRVERLIAKLLASSRQDEIAKQQQRLAIQAEQAAICAMLKRQTAKSLRERLNQEAEELVYYVKQRVFLRFGDFFKESFNPSVLRNDGRDLKKALRSALNELLAQLGFDFAQELRATTVRLDGFVKKATAQYQQQLAASIGEVNAELSFSPFAASGQVQMEFAAAFQQVEYGLFAKAMAHFKNPKAFFEQNDNKRMSEELDSALRTLADVYLQQERQRLQLVYGDAVEGAFVQLLLQMEEQAGDFYLSLLAALDGGAPTAQLLDIQTSMAALRQQQSIVQTTGK